jgi:hypothetical protein
MANLNRKWKRVMAIGCSHGEFVHPAIRKQVLEFRRRFKPEVRFELGDLIDTACFRSGAQGTKDEARSPRDDQAAATRWLQEYEPNRIAWGNHCTRLYDLQDHPKAIVAELARRMWHDLTDQAAKLKAKTVPYDIEEGWFEEGGYCWGHGYMYNLSALRDHAEMNGMPTVMAHLHYAHQVEGRTRKDTPSFCTGAIADDRNLKYGRRRRNSLTHGHGIVYGEMSDKQSYLWLIRSKNNEPLHFPPNV